MSDHVWIITHGMAHEGGDVLDVIDGGVSDEDALAALNRLVEQEYHSYHAKLRRTGDFGEGYFFEAGSGWFALNRWHVRKEA